MPERENPDRSSQSLSDDLFSKLPEPSHQVPSVENAPPPPGSRRARREAAGDPRQAEPPAPVETSTDGPRSDVPAEPARKTETSVRTAPTLDDLFEAEHDSGRGRPQRKKRRKGCLVALIVILALIGGIVAGGFWVMNTYGDQINDVMGWGEPEDWEPGLATGEVNVTIHEGDTGSPISTALYEAGVTKTESVFYDYLVDENVAVTFYPGVYPLQEKMTAAAALEVLRDPENMLANTVGITEGGTVAASLSVITESIGIPLEELQAAVSDPGAYGVDAENLEGWLFPAVYTFAPEATAEQVIQRMVDRTRESLTAAGVAAGDEQRVLTVASIIQREGHTADFDKVSRVIENRLAPNNSETHGLLQMDSTAQYGYGRDHEGPVSSWTWSDVVGADNQWNTYVHAGLPATPISNPSDAAIKAAQNPADGPWFYFVTVNLDTGETVFSATYAEQQAAEATYRKWCEENPDSGCY